MITERIVTIRPATDDIMACGLEGGALRRVAVKPDVA